MYISYMLRLIYKTVEEPNDSTSNVVYQEIFRNL